MMRRVTVRSHLLLPQKVFASTFLFLFLKFACLFIYLFQIASGFVDFNYFVRFRDLFLQCCS